MCRRLYSVCETIHNSYQYLVWPPDIERTDRLRVDIERNAWRTIQRDGE